MRNTLTLAMLISMLTACASLPHYKEEYISNQSTEIRPRRRISLSELIRYALRLLREKGIDEILSGL